MIIVGVPAASALLVMSLTYVTGDETTKNVLAQSQEPALSYRLQT